MYAFRLNKAAFGRVTFFAFRWNATIGLSFDRNKMTVRRMIVEPSGHSRGERIFIIIFYYYSLLSTYSKKYIFILKKKNYIYVVFKIYFIS